ncbi:MAG: hypothetical protein OEX22_05295 [Cyclobacteriaceae bacterium]|nr:hypothetical protein [Cyclobacteriaceae bacterium]
MTELIAGTAKAINSLGRHLPRKIEKVKNNVIPYLKESRYKRHVSSLEEVLNCSENNLNKACNLLLLTTIEGIVRDLAEFLNEKQNLKLDLNHPKFNSLDSLLRNGNWDDDYEIDEIELHTYTQSKEPILQNYSKPLSVSEKIQRLSNSKIKINLKTRLDFLRRRFKEDRDLILHGQTSEYGSKWHLFTTFSALWQVYLTIKHYDDLYQ